MGWGTDLAIYGAALASGNTGWQFYTQRVRTKAERRERGSRVVGGVIAFLWSIDPETGFVGGIPRDRQEEAIGRYADTWDSLRHELEALRVADSRAEVDEKAAATIATVTESFTNSVWAIRQRRDQPLSGEEWENLRTKYAAAKTATEELRDAVRG